MVSQAHSHTFKYVFTLTTIAIGGDITAASAANQQSKTSQSQSSTDSSQVDGTQPILLNNDLSFSTDQQLYEPDKQLSLYKNFQALKSKHLLQEEMCLTSSSVSKSGPSISNNEKLLKLCKYIVYVPQTLVIRCMRLHIIFGENNLKFIPYLLSAFTYYNGC